MLQSLHSVTKTFPHNRLPKETQISMAQEFSVAKNTNGSFDLDWGFLWDKCKQDPMDMQYLFSPEKLDLLYAFQRSQGDPTLPIRFGDLLMDHYFAESKEWEWRKFVFGSDWKTLNKLNNITVGLVGGDSGLTLFDILATYEIDRPVNFLGRGKDGVKHPCLKGWSDVVKSFFREAPANCGGENVTENSCCQLECLLQENIELVFKVLKYTIQPTARLVHETEEKKEIDYALSKLEYEVRESTTKANKEPVIVACKFGARGLPESNCPHFAKGYTPFGIAYVFNAPQFHEMYKRHPVGDAFYKEIVAQDELIKETLPRNVVSKNGIGSLEVYVDVENINTPSGEVYMTLHNPWELSDFASGLELDPGYTYTVSVKLSKVVSQPEVLGLPMAKRNCKADSEGEDLKLFKKYRYQQTYNSHLNNTLFH